MLPRGLNTSYTDTDTNSMSDYRGIYASLAAKDKAERHNPVLRLHREYEKALQEREAAEYKLEQAKKALENQDAE